MKTLTLVAALTLALPAVAPAPERQTQPAPSGLVVELKVNAVPPRVSHHPVPTGAWDGGFRRLRGAKVPVTLHVRMKTQAEGDGVRVRVAASEDNFTETEIPVATRLLRVGESAAVAEELSQVGFEPAELRLLRVNRAGAAPLRVTSAVTSVAVVGVEARPTDFPDHRVTLRNLSGKAVVGLGFNSVKPDGRRESAGWHDDPLNRTLAKPGDTYEATFKWDGRGTAAGDSFTPRAPEPVEVAAVVFSDYSFEGDARQASRVITVMRGRRAQLVRTVAMLRQPEAVAATGGLRARNMYPAPDFTDADFAELSRQFPTVAASLNRDALWTNYTNGIQDVRRELSYDIGNFEKASKKGGGRTLPAWVAELREKYDAWLARL